MLARMASKFEITPQLVRVIAPAIHTAAAATLAARFIQLFVEYLSDVFLCIFMRQPSVF
jgi:hypothetical protein